MEDILSELQANGLMHPLPHARIVDFIGTGPLIRPESSVALRDRPLGPQVRRLHTCCLCSLCHPPTPPPTHPPTPTRAHEPLRPRCLAAPSTRLMLDAHGARAIAALAERKAGRQPRRCRADSTQLPQSYLGPGPASSGDLMHPAPLRPTPGRQVSPPPWPAYLSELLPNV
jgi:hypothetical protein